MPNYARNDMEAARAAREEMDKSSVPWFKPQSGADDKWAYSYVRVCPPHVSMVDPTSGAHRFYHPVCLHFNVGPAKKVVPCPRRMLDRFCPICDVAFALKNSGQERAGNDLLPTWQSYVNVIEYKPGANGLEPVKSKTGAIEVKVWSASRGVLDQIFDALEERFTETGVSIDIADPESGYILKIGRKGRGKEDTKYKVTVATEPTSIMAYVDEWDEQLHNLAELSPAVGVEQMKAFLEGGEQDVFDKKALPAAAKPAVVAGFPDDEDTVTGEFREVASEDATDDAAARLRELMNKKASKVNA